MCFSFARQKTVLFSLCLRYCSLTDLLQLLPLILDLYNYHHPRMKQRTNAASYWDQRLKETSQCCCFQVRFECF